MLKSSGSILYLNILLYTFREFLASLNLALPPSIGKKLTTDVDAGDHESPPGGNTGDLMSPPSEKDPLFTEIKMNNIAHNNKNHITPYTDVKNGDTIHQNSTTFVPYTNGRMSDSDSEQPPSYHEYTNPKSAEDYLAGPNSPIERDKTGSSGIWSYSAADQDTIRENSGGTVSPNGYNGLNGHNGYNGHTNGYHNEPSYQQSNGYGTSYYNGHDNLHNSAHNSAHNSRRATPEDMRTNNARDNLNGAPNKGFPNTTKDTMNAVNRTERLKVDHRMELEQLRAEKRRLQEDKSRLRTEYITLQRENVELSRRNCTLERQLDELRAAQDYEENTALVD